MTRCVWIFATALFGVAMQAHGAGGHHAVDDAAILEPGQCQFETWTDREAGAARTLIHVGSACRVGPAEVGLNVERTRLRDGSATVGAGPQIKWARTLGDKLSVGALVSANWQDTSTRFVGSTGVLLLTWQPSETLLAHVNVGRDFLHRDLDEMRAGVALEWAPVPAWSFVAERYREGGVNMWRAGARYVLSSAVNVDFSQARGVSGSALIRWTLGVLWVFDR